MNHYFCPYNGAQFYGEYTKWANSWRKHIHTHSYLNRALTLKLVPLVRPHFSYREKKI